MAAMAASDDYQNEFDTAVRHKLGGNKNLKEAERRRAEIEAKDAAPLLGAAGEAFKEEGSACAPS